MRGLWGGTVLHVDLTTGQVKREPTEKYLDFIGGRGINVKLLYDAIPPGADPLGPDNAIVFGVGPLTGTMIPGTGRADIAAKSPLTGWLGESNLGGNWAAEFKWAGYDNLIVTGRAEKPVYLAIVNETVEIRDASFLWGKADTFEASRLIKQDMKEPDVQVLAIGKAGENKVRYASVITKMGDAAGRTGMGAVMGSKNLKAVAVRGTKGVKLANPDGFFEAAVEARGTLETGHPEYERLSALGTAPRIDSYGHIGLHVRGNYESTKWNEDEEITGMQFRESHNVKKFGCFACPIRCLDFYHIPEIGSAKVSCNSYSNINLRAKNMDMDVFWKTIIRCQTYGIDTLSVAGIISWMMELYEKGIIDEKDTDGIPMRWGDGDAILGIIDKIANREGVGDYLADGLRAAEHFGPGSEYHLMQVKGMPLYDINALNYRGKVLGTIIGVRGDHLRGGVNLENDMAVAAAFSKTKEEWEAYKKEYEERAQQIAGTTKAAWAGEYEGKAPLLVKMEESVAVTDMAMHCKWHSPWDGAPIGPDQLAKYINVGSGTTYTGEELLFAGRRLRNLERAFDIRQGLTPDVEVPPKRFFKQGLPGRFPADDVLDMDKVQAMKDEYFTLRGWETKTGTPKRATLEALGLASVADDLEKQGKLRAKKPVEVQVPA